MAFGGAGKMCVTCGATADDFSSGAEETRMAGGKRENLLSAISSCCQIVSQGLSEFSVSSLKMGGESSEFRHMRSHINCLFPPLEGPLNQSL